MAIVAKQLADGLLPAAEADLYVVPNNTTTYIKSIILYSTATPLARTLYMKPGGGASRVIASVLLGAAETFYFNESLVLDAGDAIRGHDGGDTGAVVDYTIYGAEET